ncbi:MULTISPECIES: asparagine synthase (glutamine-hydrolyzing) [Bradyrhizobium]|uniref:asparagine synthase (glutamine-hydrolyzing) n=1 Tax=Bradyrhizobium TaxID=374 RepID=UPI000577B7EE|nr:MULTISPECIES: asparagine synthase (glutamine-hydrolyzing) [Bradyrhizobium]BBO04181.1 asparagine synthetase B [Bradyrhizobium ottawaense]GMO46110.1 asparagine synthase (glutamine-hydrolyzing) [Bradyrhizobium ottawaense]
MCGLVGGIWRDGRLLTADAVAAALRSLAHRGPDAAGDYLDAGVFLGHRRLSIIDLDARSTQPMHTGALSIVFNGEIYNYRELRAALQVRGCVFRTQSDTEVLLAAFALDGLDALRTFEGMFSFAIWDREARRLTLARDRYGEKPLVYLEDRQRLLFASEIPAVDILAENNLEVDRSNLPSFFRFSYLPIPMTPYRDMKQLRPGHWLQLDVDDWAIREGRYYRLPDRAQKVGSVSFDDAKQALRQRLVTSVGQRLAASDVPIATFLSGGLDSSIVSSIAAKVSGRRIAAYSIGFPNDPPFDESPYARMLAARYPRIDHHVIDVTEDGLMDFTNKTLALLGEPYADASIIPTAFLCSHVKEKVILGGDGADELFGGYGVYSAMMMSARIPRWAKRLAQILPIHRNPASLENPILRAVAFFRMHLRPTGAEEYLSWRSYASPQQIESLGFDVGLAEEPQADLLAADLRDLHDILRTDIEFNLPGDMLKKVDLASMQHSLEVRLPFLDSGLVEFALSLPSEFLIKRGVRKYILREAFKDDLPTDILTRGKKGFLLPIRKWMKSGKMREELLELARRQTVLDWRSIQSFADEHRSGIVDHSPLLWASYVLLKWDLKHGARMTTSQSPESILGESAHRGGECQRIYQAPGF